MSVEQDNASEDDDAFEALDALEDAFDAFDALEEQDKNVGLVTLCIGGGMGVATIIERI